MDKPVTKVEIAGGGSAGWLTAGLLAAELAGDTENGVQITLVESPDVPVSYTHLRAHET